MTYQLDPYEYALILRPYEDDDNNMNMAIGMCVPDNDHPEDWKKMSALTMMLLSAAFVLMNEDDEFYEVLMSKLRSLRDTHEDGNYMSELFDEDTEEVSYEYVDDEKKVIQLNMFTKTKGSA
jgi:hypothetical protein